MYQAYYGSIARSCAGVPTAVVKHEELILAPYRTLAKLHADLTALGVEGLSMPSEDRINRLIRPGKKQDIKYLASEHSVVGRAAIALSASISHGQIEAPVASPWLFKPLRRTEAYATLLTTSNVNYFRGALVLGSSIRSFDSTRDLICLITSSVPEEWRDALALAGWTIVVVEEVPEFWFGKSDECLHFSKDQGERWGHMATKLRVWQQVKYSRILYLDADAVLTGNADVIFEETEGFAAERARYHSHFNAGILLLTPSQSTYDELIALGGQEHRKTFGGIIDCTEQGLLNSYYDGSNSQRSVTKLLVGRADYVEDWQASTAPFAVHWITHTCPKPWLVADGVDDVPSHCDPAVYDYWHRIWSRLTVSATDHSSQGSIGSRNEVRQMMRLLSEVRTRHSSRRLGWLRDRLRGLTHSFMARAEYDSSSSISTCR